MENETQTNIIHWIYVGVFPFTVMLSVGFGYDEIVSRLQEMGKEYELANDWLKPLLSEKEFVNGGNYSAMERVLKNEKTGKNEHYFYIIITDDFHYSDREMCKLAHEVLHICQFALPDILGDVLREHEGFAYTHTFIMEECLKAMRGDGAQT